MTCLELLFNKGEPVARKRAIVIHSTLYDGFLEEACVAMGIPVFSVTENMTNHAFATTVLGNELLEVRLLQL